MNIGFLLVTLVQLKIIESFIAFFFNDNVQRYSIYNIFENNYTRIIILAIYTFKSDILSVSYTHLDETIHTLLQTTKALSLLTETFF